MISANDRRERTSCESRAVTRTRLYAHSHSLYIAQSFEADRWFTNRSLFLTTGYSDVVYEWRGRSRETRTDAHGRRNSLRPSKNYKQASQEECRMHDAVPGKTSVHAAPREFGNSRALIGSVLRFAEPGANNARAHLRLSRRYRVLFYRPILHFINNIFVLS